MGWNRLEAPGDLENGPLGHAVDEKVGLAVKQHGTPDFVGPEIIVRGAAERCLDTAHDYR